MDAKYCIERLKGLGLTQYRIAKESGIDEATVSRIANDKQTDVKYSTVMKLQHLVTLREHTKKKSTATR